MKSADRLAPVTLAAALIAAILGFSLLGSSAFAQDKNEPDQGEPVTIVSHVDIKPNFAMPQAAEDTSRLFRAETAATQQDKGLISYVVLQQVGSTNHFTIVETWHDARAYEIHEGSEHTVKFRQGIQPFLGSPFDSRMHHVFR